MNYLQRAGRCRLLSLLRVAGAAPGTLWCPICKVLQTPELNLLSVAPGSTNLARTREPSKAASPKAQRKVFCENFHTRAGSLKRVSLVRASEWDAQLCHGSLHPAAIVSLIDRRVSEKIAALD